MLKRLADDRLFPASDTLHPGDEQHAPSSVSGVDSHPAEPSDYPPQEPHEATPVEPMADRPLAEEQLTEEQLTEEQLTEEQLGEEPLGAPWVSNDSQAFLVSLLFHVVLLLTLAVVPYVATQDAASLFFKASPVEPIEEFTLIEEVAVSEEMSTKVGANSDSTTSGMALSMAPVLAELSELPSPSSEPPTVNATYDLNQRLEKAVGLVRSDTVVKGMTGVGTTGTDGAVDRITFEILRSMEERPTLVVWFFDQSGSLTKRRQEIRDRFDRIYEELGIVSRSSEEMSQRKLAEEPLLTSIFAFGEQVNLLTPKPTADLDEIRNAIDRVELDASGIEFVFSALYKGVEKYKAYRSSKTGRGPERNVIFIAVTDERGNDVQGLDATIKECTKFAIPVYVIGVPAPFGRDVTYVKYVDPDPQFDQSPQWAEVDQGPESIMAERVRLGYRDDAYEEPVIDSGFGPFALSRLAYETGGIYFTVHPNRRTDKRVRSEEIEPFAAKLEYFFDPEVMVKYRPDYVSAEDYIKRVSSSPLRQVLTRAATLPRADTLVNPQTRFVKTDEAALVTTLTQAQQPAARVEPQLDALAAVLQAGEAHRKTEVSPRWIAGFDLAYGTVLAHRVRTHAYNQMLAKAKRGMNFESPQNNTWILKRDREISVGSKVEKEAERALALLTEVAEKHRGTPWGLLASRELETPLGWKWVEEYTDLNPPRSNNAAAGNNPAPAPPQDDQARMLPPPPPKRPIPKL